MPYISNKPPMMLTPTEWRSASKIVVSNNLLDAYRKNQGLIKIQPLTGLVNLTNKCTSPFFVHQSPLGSELDVIYKVDIAIKTDGVLHCFQCKSSPRGAKKYNNEYGTKLLSGSLGLKNAPCCLIPSQNLAWCRKVLQKTGLDFHPDFLGEVNALYHLWSHLGKKPVPKCVLSKHQLMLLAQLGAVVNKKEIDLSFLFI